MSSRRTAKLAHAILETVSTTILFYLKDPRVKNVTVLNVEVADDLRTAKVYVSVMGSDKEQALCMHGLHSARGFIQSKLSNRLQTRYIPVLTFVLDQSVKLSAEASRILKEVLPQEDISPPSNDSSSGSETGEITDEETTSEASDDTPSTDSDHSAASASLSSPIETRPDESSHHNSG